MFRQANISYLSPWGHSGDLWGHSGEALGTLWGHFWDTLGGSGTFWGHSREFWEHSGGAANRVGTDVLESKHQCQPCANRKGTDVLESKTSVPIWT